MTESSDLASPQAQLQKKGVIRVCIGFLGQKSL